MLLSIKKIMARLDSTDPTIKAPRNDGDFGCIFGFKIDQTAENTVDSYISDDLAVAVESRVLHGQLFLDSDECGNYYLGFFARDQITAKQMMVLHDLIMDERLKKVLKKFGVKEGEEPRLFVMSQEYFNAEYIFDK